MGTIRFNDALRLAAEGACDPALPKAWSVRVVRDIYGRLRFAVDAYRPPMPGVDEERDAIPASAIFPVEAHERLLAATARLGRYATSQQVLFRDDFSNPASLFESVDWHEVVLPTFVDADGATHPELTVNVLDRQIVGQDWLNTHARVRAPNDPPRVVPHREARRGMAREAAAGNRVVHRSGAAGLRGRDGRQDDRRHPRPSRAVG